MISRVRIGVLGLTATAVTAGLATLVPATATAAPSIRGSAHRTVHTCAAPAAGEAACDAILRTDVTANAAPSGYGPADIQSAYNLPSATAGSGQTVAIVDAYDDPSAEADLGVYRSQYGLPACTTANGCFRKVDQNGGSKLPRTNAGWATEISLDLDMVSAACPNCKILLVEASSASMSNLGAGVNTAAALGATSISNSYGGSDQSDASAPYYNHPGIAITASSGDSGYGAQFPASSHYVTAVGGTSLTRSGTGFTESAWSGAGSGCSTNNTALTGQAGFNTGCSMRAEADVSAVADPNTGVSVYDSTSYQGHVGWQVYGGTSASSPIIASVYALAGNTKTIDNNYVYSHASSLHDVTSGSNGTCPTSQWCTAGAGWDGPTGLGTPNGVGAF